MMMKTVEPLEAFSLGTRAKKAVSEVYSVLSNSAFLASSASPDHAV